MRGSSSLVGGSESMTNPIVVSKHARFWIPYRNRDFLDTTRPFIGEIAGRVAKTGDLEDSVLRAAERSPAAVPYFTIEPGRILETFALRDEFFFADAQPRSLFIERGSDQYEIPFSRDFSVATQELRNMNTVLSLSASGLYDAEAIRTRLNGDDVVLFDFLLNNGLLTSESRNLSGFAPARCSGVYRLQHASLLYRTSTTGVLVDPPLHSTYGSITADVHRDHLNSKVDAILISHFHEDHWFLATLLMFDRDTPIEHQQGCQKPVILMKVGDQNCIDLGIQVVFVNVIGDRAVGGMQVWIHQNTRRRRPIEQRRVLQSIDPGASRGSKAEEVARFARQESVIQKEVE